jgi:hypothetical protein
MAPCGIVLAEVENFGRVYDCGSCGCIHLQVGAVTLTLSPDAYLQVVAMLNTSAANFELWLSQRGLAMEREDSHESS